MIILARRHGSTGPPVWNRALPVKISRVAREFAAIRCRERGHLVHIADAGERLALASQAVSAGWTVEMLEGVIASREPTRPAEAPRLGRPPQPIPVNRLAKVEQAVSDLQTEAPSATELDGETARKLLERAEAAQQALATWVEALRSRVAG